MNYTLVSEINEEFEQYCSEERACSECVYKNTKTYRECHISFTLDYIKYTKEEVRKMSRNIKDFKEEFKNKVVQHFKGGLYFILGFGLHTETNEEMVIYFKLSENDITYIRPLEMFMSKVDKEKHPEAKQEYRFEIAK